MDPAYLTPIHPTVALVVSIIGAGVVLVLFTAASVALVRERHDEERERGERRPKRRGRKGLT